MGVVLSTIDMSREHPIESRSTEQWIEYDNYIRHVADSLPKGTDIKYLMPRQYGNKINYSQSAFNSMSAHLKRLSATIYETASTIQKEIDKVVREYIKQKYDKSTLKHLVVTKPMHQIHTFLNYPSLLRVFKDTTTNDGKNVIFLPIYLYFDGMILNTFNEFLKYKKIVKRKRDFWGSAKNLESIYSNKYDIYFDEFIKDKSDSWAFLNVKPTDGPVLNWGGVSSDITPGYEAKLLFMLYDKLMYSKIIPYILKECKNGGIVNALGLAHRGQLGHNISIIFWQQGDILQCGIYDPMFFIRDEDEPSLTYNIPLASIYVTLKIISKEYGFNINIINLSNFCYNIGKGISCLQYYMNAEYCSIYSMYFFLMLAKRDFDCDITSLRATVMDTYIVPPMRLTRHDENIEYTNTFTLVTMSFILTVLTLVSNKSDILDDINLKYNSMYDIYGIKILEPSIKELLNEKLKGAENIEKKGGYHKSRKRRRLYRRTHKHIRL